ncbi:MAG TPA: hypothetical protein VFU31_03650 [Candidatus Binatia bacterium]|nr:hypothetical protein [Candidatus Binatia bacterium]
MTFDEINCCSAEGKSLIINQAQSVNCGSFDQARSICNLINAAVPISRVERKRLVGSFIARRFARDQAGRRLNAAAGRLKVIRIACSVFFLFLFVIVPLVVIFSGYGLNHLIIPIALIMIGLTVPISVLYYFAHKELYPDLKEERVTNLVKMALCPPGAIRAADLLAADVVASFDPVVIASLLGPNGMDKFVASYSRDLKFPIKHELSEPRSLEITEWYNNALLECTVQYLAQMDNGHWKNLFAAPPRDEGSLSYCPRCQSQFNIVDADCPDCRGIALCAYGQNSLEEEAKSGHG